MEVKHTTETVVIRYVLAVRETVMNRRTFLATSASTALRDESSAAAPEKIAAIMTEYRPHSHADVIVGKYLEGFNQDEQPPYPRSKIVSMFTEQVPKQDMSRERAKKYNVPIFRTVADALTLGRRQTCGGRSAADWRARRLSEQR